jgi:predicted RNase H-like HicB family nuclease
MLKWLAKLIRRVWPTNIEFTVMIVIEPDGDGFHAFCPALKGLHIDGQTEEEALQNAMEGAILYLESLIRHGDPIPIGVGVRDIDEYGIPPQSYPKHSHCVKKDLAIALR